MAELYKLDMYEPEYTIDNAMILIQHSEIFKPATKNHYHDFYEFTLVESGVSIHYINGHYIPTARSNLTFIRPADCHCYMYYKSSEYTMFNIRISVEVYNEINDFLRGVLDRMREPELPVSTFISERSMERYSAVLRRLADAPASVCRGAEMKSVLCDLFFELLNAEEPAPILPEWMDAIIDVIRSGYTEDIDLKSISCNAGVSHEHVCRCFRKYLGITPSQYVNAVRLEKAANLLVMTKKDILQISYEVGFNNVSYFCRQFGDRFHISPSKYRALREGEKWRKIHETT